MSAPANKYLDAALAYAAERCWSVFPIEPSTKRPYKGTRGFKDATTDPAQIRAWWEAEPEAWLAVWCRGSGLVAFDVDPRNGGTETLARLEAQFGPLPRALVQESNSGGLHLFFRDPSPGPDGWTRTAKEGGGEIRGKADKAGCGLGVDLKCNGYVLLSPSGRYRWLTEGDAPALPDRWRDEVLRKPAAELNLDGEGLEAWETPSDPQPLTAADRERLRQELRDLGPRAKGRGTTWAAVRTIFHGYGLSTTEGEEYLSAWNASCGLPHDGASLTRQLHQIAEKCSAGERGHKRSNLSVAARIARAWYDPRAVTLPEVATSPPEATPTASDAAAPERPALVPLADLVPQIEPVPPPAPGSSAALLAQALTDFQAALAAPVQTGEAALLFEPAAVLLQRKYPPTVWLARGLVKRGGTLLVGGTPKSGKSWMLTELAMAVATGTQAFGEFTTGAATRVAYFYAEDLGQDVQAHLSALAVGRGMTPANAVRNLYVQPRGRFLDLLRDEDCALVVASCRAIGGVGLLCIEPLRDLHSGEEDKSDAMRDVMRRLRVISELLDGCTIGVAHHLNKSGDSKQGGQRMRGSSAIHGSTDSGIYLSGLDATGDTIANAVEVEIKGARGAGRFDLTLTLVDGPDGTSERATWAVSRTEPRAGSKVVPAKASSDAELVLRAITKASKGNEYRTLNGWKDGGVANESGAALSARRVTDAVLLLESQNRIRRDERDPHTGAMNPRGALIVPSSVSGPKRAPAAPHAATAAYTNVPEA